MKKLIAILLLAPLASFAQYGGGGGNNNSNSGPGESTPGSEASRIPQKKKAAPVQESSSQPAALEKFTPTPIEAPPAPNQCKKPDLSVTINSKASGDVFNANNAEYRNCIQDYVNAQKVAGDQHSAAANATVQDFNAFSTELNEKFGKGK